MAEEEQSQKTEPATPQKREEARRKGQVAQSKEVQNVAILATALVTLGSFLGVTLAQRVGDVLRASFSGAAVPPSSIDGYHGMLIACFASVGGAMLPILALLTVAGAGIQIAQTGPLLSFEALQFKGSRIDPIAGLKRLVNLDRIAELVKALLKVGALGGVAWLVVRGDVPRILGLTGSKVDVLLVVAGGIVWDVGVSIILVLTVIAVADLAYQRWRYEQRLRMSKKEVRDEVKQREGDAQLRSRFRAAHQEISRSRMISAVATADVVVVNPTHFAVAMRFDRGAMSAPEVVAKGRDRVALRIREAALEHGVPIVDDPPLARVLHKTCEVGREIPENLFQAVAEVLAQVYRLRGARAAWPATS